MPPGNYWFFAMIGLYSTDGLANRQNLHFLSKLGLSALFSIEYGLLSSQLLADIKSRNNKHGSWQDPWIAGDKLHEFENTGSFSNRCGVGCTRCRYIFKGTITNRYHRQILR